MTPINREDSVRERAHRIWEREGRPEGGHDQHWRQAQQEISAEEEIGVTDNLENTELTSDLGIQDDLAGEGPEASGTLADAEEGADQNELGGRVKDPDLR